MLDALLATLAPAHPTRPTPPPARQVTAQQLPQPTPQPTTDPPTKLPPESKLTSSLPTAAESTPTVTPAPTPNPVPPTSTLRTETEAAIAERAQAKIEQLKLLEQKLAAIVARDKIKKQEQWRQNLQATAIQQAQAGQLEQARQTARNLALSATEQADLLNQINQIGTRIRSQERTKVSSQAVPIAQSQRLQKPEAAVPRAYTPTYPNLPNTAGVGHSIRLLQPTWKLGNGNLRLIFPLPIPALFSSGFGWRDHPITGDRRFHRGIDLAAALGTPVVSAFSGIIEAADWMAGYGLTVLISHPNSTQTLYAHLSEIFVKPGDRVTQGQAIGRVGSTGNSTGPHLHFELHQLTATGWEPIDPELALEVARVHLAKALQDPVAFQVSAMANPTAKPLPDLPQNFGVIPPPPTQKFPILHNF